MKWEKQDWATHLSALLKGKSLEVYSRLSPEDALVYDKLKEALLKRFQMSEEGFRQKFRTCKPESGETSAQFVVRLDNYLGRWIDMSKTNHTYGELKDLLLQEQFVNESNKSLALFLKERKPKTAAEMATLADQYLEAHSGVDITAFGKPKGQKPKPQDHTGKPQSSDYSSDDFMNSQDRKCYRCGDKGHLARERKAKRTQTTAALVNQQCGDQHCCSCTHKEAEKKPKPRWGKRNTKCDKHSEETAAGCLVPQSELFDCCTNDSEVVLQCGHHLPVVSAACGNSKVRNSGSGLP